LLLVVAAVVEVIFLVAVVLEDLELEQVFLLHQVKHILLLLVLVVEVEQDLPLMALMAQVLFFLQLHLLVVDMEQRLLVLEHQAVLAVVVVVLLVVQVVLATHRQYLHHKEIMAVQVTA
jgi:hypothetical protein